MANDAKAQDAAKDGWTLALERIRVAAGEIRAALDTLAPADKTEANAGARGALEVALRRIDEATKGA